MIFSELYSAYYNAVARILKAACLHSVSKAELRIIVEREAFGESLLNIEPAILNERWQLLNADGTTPIRNEPTMPLTLLQRKWLKAIFQDPRIRLFTDSDFDDQDVAPLFRPKDIEIFDRYEDGDPYADEDYIQRFRMILEAVREHIPLSIESVSPRGNVNHHIVMPKYLEYSEKDDKFRLVGDGFQNQFINLARITRCERYEGEIRDTVGNRKTRIPITVELELVDDRNALERALMHFAHFEKQAEKLDELHYRIRISYYQEDETEMLIRILAFGPMVKVVSPESFAVLVRERLARQKKIGNELFVSFIP